MFLSASARWGAAADSGAMGVAYRLRAPHRAAGHLPTALAEDQLPIRAAISLRLRLWFCRSRRRSLRLRDLPERRRGAAGVDRTDRLLKRQSIWMVCRS